MSLLYQVLAAAGLVLAAPFLLARRGNHYLTTIRGRLGLGLPEPPGPRPLWIHAVSVGEVGVAATLARELPPDLPLLVTTVTPTGQARAREAFGRAPFAGRSAVCYLPFELSFAVRRLFRRFEPAALVLVEGDYWPLVLAQARRRGVPVVVVNGRVGDRSFRRMGRLRRLLGPLFGPVRRFAVQSETDRSRLVALGVDPERIEVTGNLKYDTPEPPDLPELAGWIHRLAAGRPVLVAGSTMGTERAGGSGAGGEAEEVAVARAFRAAGGGDRALLLVAPRHPERWDAAEAVLRDAGLSVVRRSELGPSSAESAESAEPAERPDVLLLDTMGELAAAYRHAAAAFIGGTLVPTGGHNPLEAARFGVPVAVGPSMENFREMAAELEAAGGWRRVADAGELGEVWRTWLDDPAAAREVGEAGRRLVESNRGAAERAAAVLRDALGDALGGAFARSPRPPRSPAA